MTDAATSIPATPDYTSLLAGLKATFETEKTRRLAWRAQQLEALQRMVVECEQEFLEALATDLGKHALEAWTTELSYIADSAQYCLKNLKKWTRRRRVRTPVIGMPVRGERSLICGGK